MEWVGITIRQRYVSSLVLWCHVQNFTFKSGFLGYCKLDTEDSPLLECELTAAFYK
jgi:hypothetical protein